LKSIFLQLGFNLKQSLQNLYNFLFDGAFEALDTGYECSHEDNDVSLSDMAANRQDNSSCESEEILNCLERVSLYSPEYILKQNVRVISQKVEF
jgi:hypothetical protein